MTNESTNSGTPSDEPGDRPADASVTPGSASDGTSAASSDAAGDANAETVRFGTEAGFESDSAVTDFADEASESASAAAEAETVKFGTRADVETPSAPVASAPAAGNLRPNDAPVLGPRPVHRPQIDSLTARAFRRPRGQGGSFAPRATAAPSAPATDLEPVNRPPDAVLAEAFGRPPGSDELLQRDPDAENADSGADPTPADPWRDPEAAAALGRPAVPPTPRQPLGDTTKLTAREVLFGDRVSPRALIVLGSLAAGVGLAAGVIGGFFGGLSASPVLTSRKVSIQQESAPNKPHNQVAQVAAAVLPSVVSISEIVGDQGASGSGVIIDGGGYIVTNNHVISMVAMDTSGKGKITVTFRDGTKTPATLVGRDPKTDLAVLKVEANNLTVIRMGKSDDVQVGDDVLAIGSPLGLKETVTTGIVSALHRAMKETPEPGDDTAGAYDAVQTDAAINHGNSGGALVDIEGRLIGINTAIISDSGGSVGLGFAIPVDLVQRIAQTIIRDKVVYHPWLGVSAKSQAVENDALSGAQVADVNAGSPAAKAGIAEGDVIVKVGDRQINDPAELTVAVQSRQIGETVTLSVVRDGRQVDIPVTLESDKDAPAPPK